MRIQPTQRISFLLRTVFRSANISTKEKESFFFSDGEQIMKNDKILYYVYDTIKIKFKHTNRIRVFQHTCFGSS